MQKLRKRTKLPIDSARNKIPLGEENAGTRIANAREIVILHCINILAHMESERLEGPNAIMLGARTQYGQWWVGDRDPAKRPFYTFGPDKVADAIERLNHAEANDLADQLRYITRNSVTEYEDAAEAARSKLAQIGLPQK